MLVRGRETTGAPLRYDVIVFVAGNHDVWCGSEGITSLEKLARLETKLKKRRVRVGPVRLRVKDGRDVVVCPLRSWYDEDFDDGARQAASRSPSRHASRPVDFETAGL